MRGEDRREDGAGTVLAVAMMGLLVTVTVATSGVVGVVAAHRRAQSAADLAALAGASALQDGGDPCRQAGAIAERNGAELRQCQVDDWNVSVTVVNTMRLPGGSMDLEARGRAGPVTEGAGAGSQRTSARTASAALLVKPPRLVTRSSGWTRPVASVARTRSCARPGVASHTVLNSRHA